MRKRIFLFLSIVLIAICCILGCSEKKETSNTVLDELNSWVLKTVLENNESENVITASDIAIDQIFYGSFSQPNTSEVLVICKLLNTPHVGGLDRRSMVIFTSDSMGIVAYDEILADEVWVDTLPMGNGQDRIIFSGITTYQGISTQNLMYFLLQDNEWMETSVTEAEGLKEGYFYYLNEDMLLATSTKEPSVPSDIVQILTWNQDSAKFESE